MKASLAVGGLAAAGLLTNPGGVTSALASAFCFALFIGLIVALIRVSKPASPARHQPLHPAGWGGIGNVSSAYPVNTGHATPDMHAATHYVYGLPHNGVALPPVHQQPAQHTWTPTPLPDEQATSGDEGSCGEGDSDATQPASATAHQRRQPSSVARRAFTHRSQR